MVKIYHRAQNEIKQMDPGNEPQTTERKKWASFIDTHDMYARYNSGGDCFL